MKPRMKMPERWIECDDDDWEDDERDGSSSIMPVDPVLIVTVGIVVAVERIGHEAVHAAKSWLVCVLARREIARRLMVTVCALVKVTLRADASVLRSVSTTGIVLHRWWCMGLLGVHTRGHKPGRRSCCSAEARRRAHTVAISRLACVRIHDRSTIASYTQWVLREAHTNTSLVAVV
jgi:hypothetical protein